MIKTRYEVLDEKQRNILERFLKKRAYYNITDNRFFSMETCLHTDLFFALKEEPSCNFWSLSSGKPYQNKNYYGKESYSTIFLEGFTKWWVASLFFSIVAIPAAVIALLAGLANIGIAKKIDKANLEKNKYSVPAAVFTGLLNIALGSSLIFFSINSLEKISEKSPILAFYFITSAPFIASLALVSSCAFFVLAGAKIYDQISATKQANIVWQEFVGGKLENFFDRLDGNDYKTRARPSTHLSETDSEPGKTAPTLA